MLAQPTQQRRVVLVDDDEICSRHVAAALRRSFTDLDVQLTKDRDEALTLLADESSRLLITDAQTRHVDGLAVATSARERRPELPVIVLSNPPAKPRRIPRLGEAAWLEKPPKTDRLIGLVGRLLETPAGFTGELTIEGLPDLVQLLSMTHACGALHVRCAQRRGCLWFEEGAIVDANLDALKGADAVYEVLGWRGGTFALDRAARPAQHSIKLSVTQLLLESMCRQDHERAGMDRDSVPQEVAAFDGVNGVPVDGIEAGPGRRAPSYFRLRLPEVLTPAAAAAPGWDEPAKTGKPVPQRAAQSFQRGLEHVRGKEYDAAVLEWERAIELDPDNKLYRSNLRRLRELMSR